MDPQKMRLFNRNFEALGGLRAIEGTQLTSET